MRDGGGEALGSRFVRREAATVIHAVAGEQQIRLGRCQRPRQPLADKWPTKAVRLQMSHIFLRREVGCSFAAKAEIQHFHLNTVGKQPAFNIGDIIAALRDAVAKENDPVNAAQHFRRLGWNRRADFRREDITIERQEQRKREGSEQRDEIRQFHKNNN